MIVVFVPDDHAAIFILLMSSHDLTRPDLLEILIHHEDNGESSAEASPSCPFLSSFELGR